MNHPQILELVFGIGLFANGLLFLYQIIRILKNKAALKENDTNIEGVTFKDIVDKIPAHIYWKDLDGRCLGASELQYKNLGLAKKEYVGKTDFDLFSQELAEKIIAVDKEVLSTGSAIVCEETITHHDKNKKFYLSHKIPLKNKKNKLVALLGVSVDVTDARKQEIERGIFLENIIAAMPGNVYWMNREGVYLGCNENQALSNKLRARHDIIGKRNVDIPDFTPPEILDPINQKVMSSGNAIILEEPATYPDGKRAVFLSSKVPLRDSEGNVTGMLGISIDITDKKNAEQALKETKEKADAMNASALQVAHDIRSPLAAIMMLTQACAEIPEPQRICLREAVDRIHDIADQLLTKHLKDEVFVDSETLSPVMVSTALLSVIASKRVEYQHSKIKIVFEASAESYFAFIHANIVELKRMVSNLINNAKEAFKEECGEIRVTLNTSEQHLIIKIIDAGRGMSEEKIKQILSDDIVTTEKENGFGLGLTHVKKMLKNFNATLSIHSSPAIGTTMELMFNLAPAPEWMAHTIEVNASDCVVVLDDDQSIHGAWDEIFSERIKENSALKLIHFTHANACIDYIKSCTHPEKLLLLTDYELIGQSMNGLDVIEKTQAQRAILVTSHYENRDVLKRITLLNTKILPKMLASHVKLSVVKQKEEVDLIHIDLVLLDDDDWFGRFFSGMLASKGKTMKHYSSPQSLLEEISRYPKNTKICTDFELNDSMNGLEVAKNLHEQGFTSLYLATGHRFKQEDMPSYLRVLNDRADILNI